MGIICKLIRIVIWAALIYGGGRVTIPIPVVPITLQTCAVVFAGLVEGRAGGFMASLLYLLAGAAGWPVFAGGAGGMDYLTTAPSAGYLLAFPFGGYVAGGGARREGQSGSGLIRGLFFAALAHAGILAGGMAGLIHTTGMEPEAALRIQIDLLPGGLIKSAAAAVLAALPVFSSGKTAHSRAGADPAPRNGEEDGEEGKETGIPGEKPV